jgi:hypothetical protein
LSNLFKSSLKPKLIQNILKWLIQFRFIPITGIFHNINWAINSISLILYRLIMSPTHIVNKYRLSTNPLNPDVINAIRFRPNAYLLMRINLLSNLFTWKQFDFLTLLFLMNNLIFDCCIEPYLVIEINFISNLQFLSPLNIRCKGPYLSNSDILFSTKYLSILWFIIKLNDKLIWVIVLILNNHPSSPTL